MKAAAARWWTRALRQPQQLWLRKAIFQVHLWCGLALTLYVLLIAVSGSILVFKDELMPRPYGAHLSFDPQQCTPARLTAAMQAAAAAHQQMQPSLASCPTEARPFYAITLHPAQPGPPPSLTVYVHPQTNETVGQLEEATSWIYLVEQFHLNLLMKKNGRFYNGIGAIVLLVLALSGMALWWPGVKHWRRALKVNLALSWKRINFDLHSAVGMWTIFFTLVWAVTGIYFTWESPFFRAINAISPITTAQYPEPALDRLSQRVPPVSAASLNLTGVLAAAQQVSPRASLEGLFFGSGRNAMLTVYMARGHLGDYTRTDFLYFDQQTGKLLYQWRRGQNQTLGDWLLWLIVPLHCGTSFGMAGKVAWAALGLVLPLLVVTGFLIYWNRWLRKRFTI